VDTERKKELKESAGTLLKSYACDRMKTVALLSIADKLCINFAFNIQGTMSRIRYR
jgi:hypothetical protein